MTDGTDEQKRPPPDLSVWQPEIIREGRTHRAVTRDRFFIDGVEVQGNPRGLLLPEPDQIDWNGLFEDDSEVCGVNGNLDYLIGMDVEVYSLQDRGREPSSPMGKGRVVGVAYEPTIVLQHEDGTQSSHIASLPRVERHVHETRVGLAELPRDA